MAVVSMKQLLEAGVHFGHQTRRWNPKMAEYIYCERNGIYIIDLQKTVKKLEEAYNFVRTLAENGQTILFVGTKKQAADAVKEEASRVGMYYVNARWLGGMLTNFKTMRTRIDRLAQLKKMQEDGTFDMLPKKEVMKLLGEMEKLEKYLGGVKEMKKLPGALFVVDPRKEHNAIAEARKLHIPIVAIVDTNCDPDEIDYVIPANDDAIRAIRLIASTMANAVQAAITGQQDIPPQSAYEPEQATAAFEPQGSSYADDDEDAEAERVRRYAPKGRLFDDDEDDDEGTQMYDTDDLDYDDEDDGHDKKSKKRGRYADDDETSEDDVMAERIIRLAPPITAIACALIVALSLVYHFVLA